MVVRGGKMFQVTLDCLFFFFSNFGKWVWKKMSKRKGEHCIQGRIKGVEWSKVEEMRI